MAAGRTFKSMVGRRRRAGDEGEDDDGPVSVGDSQSEGSAALSDVENDDAEASSLGGEQSRAGAEMVEVMSETPAVNGGKLGKKAHKARKQGKKNGDLALDPSRPRQQSNFKPVADTEAMMKGLHMGDEAHAQEILDFEDMGEHGGDPSTGRVTSTALNGQSSAPAERQRHEHEEYRRKREADPAFIPNRGNFFMHDTRSPHSGQPPLPVRGTWQGRGGGRAGVATGPAVGSFFSAANHMPQAERAAEQPWKHDLHDTINEEPAPVLPKPADSPRQQDRDVSARLFPKAVAPASQGQPRVMSFSSTTLVGKVQIRVFLPGMEVPKIFPEVPWKQYTRLPNHRPPLRRDKPVRMSLPDHIQRYIFPSPERSFIFIPRQMRPNQQGFHRSSQQRSTGGYGYSSRRTSMYGGSIYASSVAASRRSSLAGGVSRADAFSPNSFASSSYASGMPPPNRPVVRLSHGAQHRSAITTPPGPLSGQQTPLGMPQMHTYLLPQQPTFQGTPTSTVHQPRPQKAISVTGIESPAMLQQASQEPQSFQNQLPAHMVEQQAQQAYGQLPPYYSPHQQYQYPQQPQIGTPLSGIPEQAVHAPSFQPPGMSYAQSSYYAPYPPQQNYYYSPPGPHGYPPMPMYMHPQGYPMMPPPAPMPQQQQPTDPPPSQSNDEPPKAQPAAPAAPSQSGMVAHESNGMVFYLPASEAQEQEQSQNYQPAEGFVPSYAMPGLPPPTPAPETSAAAYYYPPMPPQMQEMMPVNSGVYYPPQGTQ